MDDFREGPPWRPLFWCTQEESMSVVKNDFGKTKDGKTAGLYTITGKGGMEVSLTDFGATIVSVKVPDQNGALTDVVLGYDDVSGYEEGGCYFGAVIGRSGNRIANGTFTVDGKEYHLAINDNDNNLHSGPNGFDSRIWETSFSPDGSSVTFCVKDADMEQGYPGNYKAAVTYSVDDDNTLKLAYSSECDADTVSNLTNHVYFNLGGHGSGSIEGHMMRMEVEGYTPVKDHQAIPTGEVAPVTGTPLDFSSFKKIGDDIDADFDQLTFVGGYDHNFAIAPEKHPLSRFATVCSPETGICMEAFTDLPGFQFYTGNFIPMGMKGKDGAVYNKRSGFCLESQYYPNSINQEGFASPLLKAGETAVTMTAYRFGVKKA